MTDKSPFILSHSICVMPAKNMHGYLISTDEWDRLKLQIKDMKEYVDNFSTISSIFLGIAGSALVAAISLSISDMGNDVSMFIYIGMWSIFGITLSCGLTTFFFSRSQRKKQKSREIEIVEWMELIEKRFESIHGY